MSFSYEELAEIRHYIHQHPELSGQEYQTTAFLKERLEELGIRILQISMPFQFWNKRICPTKVRIQESCMHVAMIFIKPVF